MSVHFVRAIDIEGQGTDAVELEDLDAVAAQTLGTGLGAGHGALEVVTQCRQAVDEPVRRGARADAQDGIALQPRGNFGDGGRRHGVLEFVLSHGMLAG